MSAAAEASSARIGKSSLRAVSVALGGAIILGASLVGATPAVRPFSPREYDGPAQVFDITQRGDGPLLFTTVAGLREYDGERWRAIDLPGTQLAVAVDDDDRVWTAGSNQLGRIEPDENGSPRFVSLLDQLPGEPEFSDTWPILPTPEGVFFASREHLFRWRDGVFDAWPGDPEKVFYRLYRVHGRIFVARLGVGLLELVDDELRLLEAPDLPADAELNFMFGIEDGTDDGGAVVLSRRYGAFRFDGRRRLEPFDPPAERWLLDHQVQHGTELPDGRVAIASLYGGIGLFDRELTRVEESGRSADLPDDLVHSVFVDHQGHLWAGTNRGIARLEIRSSIKRIGLDAGLDGAVQDLVKRPNDLWVACASGLFVDLDGVAPYRFEKVDVPAPAWAVLDVDDANAVLVATTDGVFEVRLRRRGDLSLIAPREIHRDATIALFAVPGRDDEVLVSLANGLGWLVRENGAWRFNGRIPGVTSELRVALPAESGELVAWAPSPQRLVRLEFPAEARSPPRVRVHDLGESAWPARLDGRVVLLREDGIERYLGREVDGWPFEPDPTLAPLVEAFGETPLVLHQDENRLWVDTSEGLRRGEKVGESYRFLPVDSAGIEARITLVTDGESDEHWIGTGDGLYLHRSDLDSRPEGPPRVVLRGVEVPGADDASSLYGGFGAVPVIRLSEDRDDLRLVLATSRVQEDGIDYQVRLDAEEWSAWNDEPTRDLSNLDYGDHTVQFRARDAWGAVSPVESLEIHVERPWWWTPWALVAWTVLGFAALVAAVRWRTRQLDAERRRLEELIAERTRDLAARTADLEAQARALETANRRLADENEHRRRLEEEQSKLAARVEQSKKLESLGLMAGGIAHDFNNLLMAVLGHADLGLEDQELTPSVEPRLREIRSAAWRAADLCRQMLAYAGKRELQRSEVDFAQLVGECLDTVRVTAPPGVRFEAKRMGSGLPGSGLPGSGLPGSGLPGSGLPGVRADASQLRQVVSNLLSNATEAFADDVGSVRVEVAVRDLTRDDCAEMLLAEPLSAGRYLVLCVEDDGVGMDEATRRRIFDPFFTTKFTGRGLGLAATLGIVRAHEGALRVTSRLGEGTRFEVFLPALDHVATAPTPEPESASPPSRSAAGGTVLVVDDESIVRDVATLMLTNAGFEVTVAESGESAIEAYAERRGRIGVVVLDLTMPGLDGLETYERLRELDPSVRVILSSGYSADDITERYLEIGFVDFLHKPYRAEALRRAVAEALCDARETTDQVPESRSGANVSSTGT